MADDNVTRTQQTEKDVCETGKSCGFTCIKRSLVCRSSLSESVSGSLAKFMQNSQRLLGQVSSLITARPSPKLDRFTAAGRDLLNRYPDLASDVKRAREIGKALEQLSLRKTSFRLPQAEAEEIGRQTKALLKESLRVNQAVNKKMERVRAEMLKTSLPEKQVKDMASKIEIEGATNPAKIRSHIEEFIRMFEGRGLTDVETKNKNIYPFGYLNVRGDRSFAIVEAGNIQLDKGQRKSDIFHEIGHFVEAQRPEVYNFATKWRDNKAFDETQIRKQQWIGRDGKPIPFIGKLNSPTGRVLPLVNLNKIADRGYGSKEVAVIDDFLDPYMGKVYNWKSNNSSEVISMGVEAFSSPKSMTQLYMVHPELFEYIAGMAVVP